MGRARLTRIDALQEMAAAIEAFRVEVLVALEGLDMDSRRGVEWIHGDRTEHWRGEVRRGYDRVTQARLQLQQARIARRVGEHEPACADEKKALRQAERRLETAQEKVEAVRQAGRAIDEAVHDYRAARGPLSSWVETEAHKALATLRRMMENLEAYVAAQTPGIEAAPAAVRTTEAGQGDRIQQARTLEPSAESSSPIPNAPDATTDTEPRDQAPNDPPRPHGGIP